MIAVGGENLIDLISRSKDRSDKLEFFAVPGGGPFNVALAVGRLGHNVSYLTPISADSFGDLISARLLQNNVSVTSPRVHQPTSLAVVTVDPNAVPSYVFYRNGTAERQVSSEKLASAMPKDTTIFHVGGLSLVDGEDAEAWKQLFQRCKANSILTSLDPNIRPAVVNDRKKYTKRLRQLMRIADIIKLSDEDLTWLYPNRPLEQAVSDCKADCNAALFILTLGADGARGFVASGNVHVPAAKTHQIIDTVGAGDTFMASVLAWVIETRRSDPQSFHKINTGALIELLTQAARAAALTCEQSGCNPPSRDQLNA